MKKTTSILKAPISSRALATVANNSLHHVTIVNANANDLMEALGITADRAIELEKDIVAACIAGIKATNDPSSRLTLLDVVSIASAHATNDNEMIAATIMITEAYVNHDFDGLKEELERDETTRGSSDTSTTEDDTTQEPQSIEDLFSMVFGKNAVEASSDNDWKEEDEKDEDESRF